jgi:hypothetical protein
VDYYYYYYYVVRFYVPLLAYANEKNAEGQQNTNKAGRLLKKNKDYPAKITAVGKWD